MNPKNPIGIPFIELQSVDSTNNYAMRQVHEGVARHGTVVFAHAQTAGKGQRQKSWLAQPAANITMSMLIEPGPLFASPVFRFSMAVALAVHGVLKKNAGNGLKIKWPNDLYYRDRKAGGILIENNISGGLWTFAVIGIGLNINQTEFGPLQKEAVSLKQITGKTYDTLTLAKELCMEMDAALKKLETEPQAVVQAYHQHLYKKDEWVRLKKGARVFDAQIKGVNAAGQLVTQHAFEETFDVGDVALVMG